MVKVIKEKFVVIGKEGSTLDGEGFIQTMGKWLLAKAYIWQVWNVLIMQKHLMDGQRIIPSYEYIVVENHKGAFEETIRKMNEHGISLVGAVHDYTEPTTGKDYLYFPIREV